MKSRSCIAALYIVLCVALPERSEEPIRTARDVLRAIAIARDEVSQYAVRVDVDGKLPPLAECFASLPATEKVALELEYSRVGQHFITSAQVGPSLWGFIGRTNDLVVQGDSIDGLFVNRGSGDFGFRHSNELLILDPRAVGLLDGGQLSQGMCFESAMALFLRSPLEETQLTYVDKEWVIHWMELGLTVAVDGERSFWPVKYERIYPEHNRRDVWEVKLGRVHSKFMPLSARFISQRLLNGKVSDDRKVSLKFNWKMINGYLSTGDRGVQRLSTVHQVKIINP